MKNKKYKLLIENKPSTIEKVKCFNFFKIDNQKIANIILETNGKIEELFCDLSLIEKNHNGDYFLITKQINNSPLVKKMFLYKKEQKNNIKKIKEDNEINMEYAEDINISINHLINLLSSTTNEELEIDYKKILQIVLRLCNLLLLFGNLTETSYMLSRIFFGYRNNLEELLKDKINLSLKIHKIEKVFGKIYDGNYENINNLDKELLSILGE